MCSSNKQNIDQKFYFRIIDNPHLVKCKPGDPLCMQVGNDLGLELMIEGIRESAKMLKDKDYIFNPVGMDDGDGPLFVHPDDKRKNAGKNRNSRQNDPCTQKCQTKYMSKQCKKNCYEKQTPKRGQRNAGGGEAQATGKPGAGKGCNEKCGQLKGQKKNQCLRNKAKLQCNKGKGKGKSKGKGKGRGKGKGKRMGPGNKRLKNRWN